MSETIAKYTFSISQTQIKTAYKIGSWQLPEGEILAPMAGVTDSPYRRLSRRFGSGLLYTECISSEGLRRLGKASFKLAKFHDTERPIAVQLFGAQPQQFADAAAVVAERIKPDMIDINCGCPVKKFVTKQCGGYLMQYPDLIGKIVEATIKTSGLPVSVKLRAGYMHPDETSARAAIAAEEAGASLVAIHGRYVRKAKGTPADWEVIGRVKTAVKRIPVVGNGDLNSFADVKRMVQTTGCDRVMIARWAQGAPWIFAPIEHGYPDDNEVTLPTYKQRLDLLIEHYQAMLAEFPVKVAVNNMRKHIGWYTANMPGSAKLRAKVMVTNEPDEVMRILREFEQGMGW